MTHARNPFAGLAFGWPFRRTSRRFEAWVLSIVQED